MNRKRLTAVLAVAVGALGLPASAHASAYSEGVLASNPLMYLRLDEATGSVAHGASTNLPDGAYEGDVALGGLGPFTDAGKAVRLGKTGRVTSDAPGPSGSVELWVNPDRMVKNPDAPLVEHGNPATDGWALGVGNRRKLWWKASGSTVRTTVTLGSGVWTALTVTWDGSKLRVYRNGALAKTMTSGARPSSSDGKVVVGNGGRGFAGQFSGGVDEVALYKQVLTPSDVAAHQSATHAPINTSLPQATGVAEEGMTLTVTSGVWTNGGDPALYKYQWQRCSELGTECVDVSGKTTKSYLLAPADKCKSFQVVETVTNSYGQTASAVSNRVGIVEPCDRPEPAPENEQLPRIEGTPVVGQPLSVKPGIWSFTVGSPTYRWERCDLEGDACVPITGATDSTYVVADTDKCSLLQVVEKVTNGAVNDEATSEPTEMVTPCGTGTPGGETGSGGTGSTGGTVGTGATGGTVVTPGTGNGATGTNTCARLVSKRKLKLRGFGQVRVKLAAGVCLPKSVRALFKVRKGVKVKSVRYKLDGKRLARVKRPRFAARLKRSKLRPGKHTLTVRVIPRAGKAKVAKLRLRVVVA